MAFLILDFLRKYPFDEKIIYLGYNRAAFRWAALRFSKFFGRSDAMPSSTVASKFTSFRSKKDLFSNKKHFRRKSIKEVVSNNTFVSCQVLNLYFENLTIHPSNEA